MLRVEDPNPAPPAGVYKRRPRRRGDFIVLNTLVDIVYAALDPQIRLS